jgi:ABC-type transport system involved in multi-copper enzyme maturation permease subunit
MINSFAAEWLLLNRRRLWLSLGAVTAAFIVAATALVISTAKPAFGPNSDGLSLQAIAGPGGATAAVVFSVAFASILVLAAFASSMTNEFTRGTLRAALTRQPSRVKLIAGKLGARLGLAALLMLGALVAGWITAALVAPSQHVDTTGWWGADAIGHAAGNYARLLGFVAGYALIGTTLAILLRSTPVTLGVGLLWFGPIENVVGDGHSWAMHSFPGLLLRSVLQPGRPDSISTATAALTLLGYAAVCIAMISLVLSRRDAKT